MISQTSEYALRAIVYLAGLDNSPSVTQEIAEATHVPPGYLSKVLQSLSRAGLVSSQRGLGGGFTLAKLPASITIYEVIQAVDPFKRIRTCPLEIVGHGSNLCPLHRRLDDAIAHVEKTFKDTTVSDLLSDESRIKPLCAMAHLSSVKQKEKTPKSAQ